MPSPAKLLASASGAATDPNFRNVTLLLHGDGSNGAQNNTFIDSSSNNFTVTRNGNTTQGSFNPYGSRWSNYFDGSGDYLTAPDNAPLQLGSSDFTIEFWVNFSSVPGASQGATLVSKFNTSNTGYEVILFNNTLYFQAQSANIGLTYAWTPTAGRWYHIAWSRSGANSYGFIDGALVASTTAASGSISNLNQALQLGRRGDNTFHLNGYLSDVRVVKGTAVYTAPFTPPTVPLTAITNTSLLTCQSNRFRDASTNNFAITRNGDVRVTPFSPYAPSSAYSAAANGGSAYFDGGLDYLTTPSSAALNLQSTWTIEFWYYPIAASDAFPTPISVGNGYSDVICLFDRFNNSAAGSVFTVRVNGTGNQWNGTATVNNGAWHHVAMVCNSNALRVYVNGVLDISATISPVSSNRPVWIGTNHDNASYNTDINGYMAGVRIVNNAAVYTANFTPPTSPPSAIANTQLLCNFTNAAIVDSAADNDLETVGNAQISTSVKKFGTGSIYLDGAGDYLVYPNDASQDMGTGNFTYEMWINVASIPSFGMMWSVSSQNNYLAVMQSGAGFVLDFFNGTTDVFSSTVLSYNTWYHVACTRSNGTVRWFVNGVQDGSGTITTSIGSSTGTTSIGRTTSYGGNFYYFNGYIDDLRITKGVARYTANFTPPTAPFPDQ